MTPGTENIGYSQTSSYTYSVTSANDPFFSDNDLLYNLSKSFSIVDFIISYALNIL